MIGWAVFGIVIIVALAGGIIWWFCADARRSRARRRLVPAHDTISDTDTDAVDEWSVAAITARVERERSVTEPPWPAADASPAGLADDNGCALSPDESDDRPTAVLELPPQRTAARQRPYIHPSPLPSQPPTPAGPDLTPTPHRGMPRLSPTDLTVLQRVHEGLKHL
jgi:hypothetical protein